MPRFRSPGHLSLSLLLQYRIMCTSGLAHEILLVDQFRGVLETALLFKLAKPPAVPCHASFELGRSVQIPTRLHLGEQASTKQSVCRRGKNKGFVSGLHVWHKVLPDAVMACVTCPSDRLKRDTGFLERWCSHRDLPFRPCDLSC